MIINFPFFLSAWVHCYHNDIPWSHIKRKGKGWQIKIQGEK